MPTNSGSVTGARSRAGFESGPGCQTELRVELPCDAAAPGQARDALREIEDVGWVIGDAMLVASELVTNAVLHSGCEPKDRLTLHVRIDGTRLLISVQDPGESNWVAPDLSGRVADPFGGVGLRVVAALSRRWGAERDPGHRVWAELELPARPSRARAGRGEHA